MSFADQLRTAKSDDEQRQKEVLANAWEEMLDDIFVEIKSKCLCEAKQGCTESTVYLREIYKKLVGDTAISDEGWHPNGQSNSAWVELLLNNYVCRARPSNSDMVYCFSVTDRDRVIEGITERCKKESLTVSSTYREVKIYYRGTKKIRPNTLWETLNLPRDRIGPDENGYYTVPVNIKSDPRYQIDFKISW